MTLRWTLGIIITFAILLPRVALADHSLHFWVRAFIPNDAPTTAVGRCFKTDERTFSDSVKASSRVMTEFNLRTVGSSVTVEKVEGRELTRAGETVELDCKTRAEIARRTADVSHLRLGHPAVADGVVQLVADVSVSNPLTPPVLSPKVDYNATLTWNTKTGSLSVRFNVGRFPAFEAYAQEDDGKVVKMLNLPPDTGSDPFTLYDFGLGTNVRPVEITKQLR